MAIILKKFNMSFKENLCGIGEYLKYIICQNFSVGNIFSSIIKILFRMIHVIERDMKVQH